MSVVPKGGAPADVSGEHGRWLGCRTNTAYAPQIHCQLANQQFTFLLGRRLAGPHAAPPPCRWLAAAILMVRLDARRAQKAPLTSARRMMHKSSRSEKRPARKHGSDGGVAVRLGHCRALFRSSAMFAMLEAHMPAASTG